MKRPIGCAAHWDGEVWVGSIPQHGVYGRGRTLRALRDDIAQGLALAGVNGRVEVTAVAPELERLRAARDVYEKALRIAAAALAAQGVPSRDIAEATAAASVRQAVLDAAARKKPAAARRAVLRVPLGEPDGTDLAAEISRDRGE